MAGDWIAMRTDLAEDPAVIAIAALTGLDEDTVVGKLHRLWSWADRQTTDGNAVGVTPALLDRMTSCARFAEAMMSVHWLEATKDGFRFPKFDRWISQSAKTRALTRRRVARHRVTQKKRSCNGPGVTSSSVLLLSSSLSSSLEEKGCGERKPELDLASVMACLPIQFQGERAKTAICDVMAEARRRIPSLLDLNLAAVHWAQMHKDGEELCDSAGMFLANQQWTSLRNYSEAKRQSGPKEKPGGKAAPALPEFKFPPRSQRRQSDGPPTGPGDRATPGGNPPETDRTGIDPP